MPANEGGRGGSARARRVLLAVAVGLLAGLLPVDPASAHGQDAPVATDFRVAVSAVEPALAGLTVRVVEGGRLELSNDSSSTVEILGLQGEPFLRVRSDGVEENRNAPTLYASRTLRGSAKPPPGVDAAAAPKWYRASNHPVVRWHEERAHGGAPARAWSVPLLVDARVPTVIRGTVTQVPPPNSTLWWFGSLLGVVVLGLLALVPARVRWPVTGLAVGCGAVAVALTAAMALTATTPGATTELLAQLLARVWALLSGLALVTVAASVPLGRPAPDLAFAIAGCSTAFMAGIANGAVFSHSVIAGPGWIRPAAAVVVAVGLGLTGLGLLGWYRNLPAHPPSWIPQHE